MNKKTDDKTNLVTLLRWYRLKRMNEFIAQSDKEQAWSVLQQKIERRAALRRFRRWAEIAAVFCGLVALGVWYMTGVDVADSFPQRGEQQAVLIADEGASQYKLVSDDRLIVNEKGLEVARNTGNELIYESGLAQTGDLGKHRLEVPRGGEYRVVLTDETAIHLNAESRLSYPVVFNQSKRDVYLQGEAFFEVAKDADMPFVVHTALANVEVLGTRFNVSTYEDDEVVITLDEGSVKVTQGDAEQVLLPGEQAIITNKTITVRPVHVKDYTSWSTGVYEYKNTSLEVIVKQLSRWYDVDMTFASPAIGKRRFAGVIFRDKPLQYAIETLSQVSDVRFISKGNKIEITDRTDKKN